MPDSAVPPIDSELRAHVQRVLRDHYELEEELGRGGMGIVYKARDRRLKRPAAIKILPPELAFRSEIKTRFLREAETAAQLSHPNIVPIYSVDDRDGVVYFAMAFVSGDNLAKRLFDHGRFTAEETRRIMRDVADALAYAHERGVVHRDIKPDNIVLDGDGGRPMVTDFGIARAVSEGADARLTATGMAIGTPAYMSPEQAAGEREMDGRSDLYSLGIVAYQMLCGEPPFTASSTPAMLVKHISERPVPIEQRCANLPPDLARAIMMCLEKDPANRFPSAGALVAALDTGNVPHAVGSGGGYGGTGYGGGPYGAAATTQRNAMAGPPGYAGYPAGNGYAPTPAYGGAYVPELHTPSAEEMRRWEAPPVVAFRRKVAPYLYVNGVLFTFSLLTNDGDPMGITMLWTVYMAFKYARLWSEGFDWHDVFRQPRERELIDVAEDVVEWTKALFSRTKRMELREQRRTRALARRNAPGPMPGSLAAAVGSAHPVGLPGPLGERLRQASADRDEVLRLIDGMAPAERSQIPDVARSAMLLYDRVQGIALSIADVERSMTEGGSAAIEEEIVKLEGAANPLDHVASEERVRRLAFLKRQRRAVSEIASRREALSAKLETCAIALQNMRFDMLRLRSGAQSYGHVTSLAMQALALAENVDQAVYSADELQRPGRARTR